MSKLAPKNAAETPATLAPEAGPTPPCTPRTSAVCSSPMKRLSWLGLLPILPLAALAYACSSSDGDDPGVTPGDDSGNVTPGEDGGVPLDEAGNPIPQDGGGGGDAGPGCNPIAPLTFAPHFVTGGNEAPGEYLESPRWSKDLNELVFSAYARGQIARVKLDQGATPTLLRDATAGRSPVGNAFAPDGTLWTAEVSTIAAGGFVLTPKQVAGDGGVVDAGPVVGAPFVPAAESAPLNAPNDLVVSAKNVVYVTDPAYTFQADGVSTGIYRIGADRKVVAVEKFDGQTYPNAKVQGITLSPKEDTLYVALGEEKRIRKYPINADGSTGAGADIVQTEGTGVSLAADEGGNLYLASSVGIEVFDGAGKKLGKLAVPATHGAPTGIAFAGADKKTLIVTTGDFAGKGAIYRAPSTCVGRW